MKTIIPVLPHDRKGTTTPVRGKRPVVPAKITNHCAMRNIESPAASSMRSGVRFQAAIQSPWPAMAMSRTR
jgi:hypothetical protein